MAVIKKEADAEEAETEPVMYTTNLIVFDSVSI